MPLNYGARVIGAIVVSKLGLDQFDEDDLRLLEVLAGHASVALENARLYEAQRREAESAKALLEFGRDLAAAEGLDRVLDARRRGRRAAHRRAERLALAAGRRAGDLVGRAAVGYEDGRVIVGERFAAAVIAPYVDRTEPYAVTPEQYAAFSDPPAGGSGSYMIAPFTSRDAGARSPSPRRPTSTSATASSSCSAASPTRRSSRSRTPPASQALERTFLSTVEALANALEASDEYTSSHARWITDTALRVGQELGLDGDTLKRLELGALFHDIGKIGIPNSVLLKPGPLTDEERQLIETHPELGERILAPIDQLQDVCGDRALLPRALGRRRATPTARPATRSRSRRGSSSPATRTTR